MTQLSPAFLDKMTTNVVKNLQYDLRTMKEDYQKEVAEKHAEWQKEIELCSHSAIVVDIVDPTSWACMKCRCLSHSGRPVLRPDETRTVIKADAIVVHTVGKFEPREDVTGV